LATSTAASEICKALHQADLIQILPELHKIMKIFAVIPATTCTAERSFSGLLRMKTYLRNTTGQDRLYSVALINIERCYANKVIENVIDSVTDTFSERKHRHRYFFQRTEIACSFNIWKCACLCGSHIVLLSCIAL